MTRPGIAGSAIVAAACVIYFLPPPAGASPTTMHGLALVTLAIGFWAFAVLPEYLTGLLLLLLAVLLSAAPAAAVFSGFTTATIWLVFGGLVIAEAVRSTGLGERLGRLLLDRYVHSYPAVMAGVAAVATILCCVMPATIARVLLLLPLLTAVAGRMGFAVGSPGYNGLILCGVMTTYHCGTAVLPSNAPNLVLMGAAESLYGVQLIYAEYLAVQGPVIMVLKTLITVGVILVMCPATGREVPQAQPHAPMSADERRLTAILIAALLLWATDFAHHIKAGWIALAAGLACVLPRIGVMPMTALNDRVRYGPFFYIGAILGLGGIMTESGLTQAIGAMLIRTLNLTPGADAFNFGALVLMSSLTGIITTNPAQPALLTPLAGHFAEATGWPLKTVLMTMAVGYSTMIFPHMVPPAVVGFALARIPYGAAMRVCVVLTLFSLLVLAPLDFLWWRVIGYLP